MRLSELLHSEVVDDSGRYLGRVHDVRLSREGVGTDVAYRLGELVIGPWDLRTRVAHAWGYAEGHAQGPSLIRAFAARGIEETKVVSADRVIDWSPRLITISAEVAGSTGSPRT